MTEEQLAERAAEVRRTGYTILRGQIPPEAVAEVAAAFAPVWEDHLEEIRANPNRGPMRHYIQLPFEPPFYQSRIHGDPGIVGVVRKLLGEDAEMVQYASDTPAKGSVHQDWHGDVPPSLFPDEPDLVTPPALIAVNFPFVDVGRENGPFEVAEGSHRMPRPEALERIGRGGFERRELLMKVGDVLIRDPRCLHRGTPNRTDTPRPVAVIGFERAWYRLISLKHHNPVRREFWETLPEPEQQLLRRNVEPPG